MTLVVIGPVTEDLVIIGTDESRKVGGATYFQSFVFEKFFSDYLAIINCADEDIVNDFPNPHKVKVIKKESTHFFINRYPFKDNLDIRQQLSNFADIPILPSDLESVLPDKIDGFVINPLNRYDFPADTLEFLKSFDVPVFVSVQGFLRVKGNKVNENYALKLSNFDKLNSVLSDVNAVFLDEGEESIIGSDYDVDEIVITNGSHGSRIISSSEIKIDPVECDEVVDTTGCGDTYMAAYVSQRLKLKSPEEAGKFASKIASDKIADNGPYMHNK